ncbi:MAG: heavy metal-binding domain-containing protein [Gaiellaceae bacterium]
MFGRRSGPDDAARREARAEQEASIAALTGGGLPKRAEERLRAAQSTVFTSDLSVSEFALAGQARVRPVAQVMGSSVYHVGWQRRPGGWAWQAVSQELTVLSQAWNEARRLAFGRLQREAEVAGAHTVVGLDLRVGAHDWVADAVEYVAVGTAVRVEGEAAGGTALTNLSLQDYWLLRRAGYRPAGLYGATAVFYVVSSWRQQQAQSLWRSWANQELPDFTQGVYDAREVTIGRLTEQAKQHDAIGVVGLSLEHTIEEREVDQQGANRTDLIVTMHALGTGIVEADAAPGLPATRVAIDLSGGRRKDHLLGGER